MSSTNNSVANAVCFLSNRRRHVMDCRCPNDTQSDRPSDQWVVASNISAGPLEEPGRGQVAMHHRLVRHVKGCVAKDFDSAFDMCASSCREIKVGRADETSNGVADHRRILPVIRFARWRMLGLWLVRSGCHLSRPKRDHDR